MANVGVPNMYPSCAFPSTALSKYSDPVTVGFWDLDRWTLGNRSVSRAGSTNEAPNPQWRVRMCSPLCS